MATATGGWWTQQLPSGWEAKYDHNQGRYFFINHQTRQTTWEDPRQTLWQQQQQRQAAASAQAPHPQSQRSTRLPYHPSPSAAASAQSHVVTPTRPATASTQHAQWHKQVEDKFGLEVSYLTDDDEEGSEDKNVDDASNEVLDKLKHDFPGVDESLLKDILRGVTFNDFKARQELRHLGYRSLGVQDSSPSTTSSSTPQRSVSPKPVPAPQPNQLTQIQKSQLKDKITKEFVAVPNSTIEMALDVCQFDEFKTCNLLKALDKPKVKPTEPSPGLKREETISSPATLPAPKRTTEATRPSPIIPTTQPQSRMTTGVSAASSDKSVVPNRFSPSHTTQIQITSRRSSSQSPRQSQSPAKQQPKPSGMRVKSKDTINYVSALKSKPEGPNKELVQGPNPSKLIHDYIETQGPDPSNLQGPNTNNVQGPTTSLTFTSCFATGASFFNRKGADRSLITGPMYKQLNVSRIINNN